LRISLASSRKIGRCFAADMHRQSASRTNDRTPAAVFAMLVRSVLITVLKSAGIPPARKCGNLSAGKFDASNPLCLRGARFLHARNFRFASVAESVRKFQALILRAARRQPSVTKQACDEALERYIGVIAMLLPPGSGRANGSRGFASLRDGRRDAAGPLHHR
jgi:hypothetical protein